MTADQDSPPKWWVIREDALLAALRAVQAGENPDLVMLDLVAHSDRSDDEDGA